jgi:cytochrome o ubiquinol oxidase subunit 1
MFGKLTWQAIPWDQPIPLAAGALVGLALIGVMTWVVIKGHLP